MLRLLVAFVLLMVMAFGVAYAGIFDVLGKVVGSVNPVAGLLVGTVGSLITGKAKKDKTKLPNDLIPASNATLFGTGAAVVSQDPVTTLATMMGAVLANWLHQAFKRLKVGGL